MFVECVPTGHFPEAVARPILLQSLERHLNFESPGPRSRLAHCSEGKQIHGRKAASLPDPLHEHGCRATRP